VLAQRVGEAEARLRAQVSPAQMVGVSLGQDPSVGEPRIPAQEQAERCVAQRARHKDSIAWSRRIAPHHAPLGTRPTAVMLIVIGPGRRSVSPPIR
jgi:hypothetical protein